MIDWPLEQILALEGLPAGLRAVLPALWHVGLAIGVMAAAYVLSLLVKRLIKAVGRRRLSRKGVAYDGSSWDLIDSGVQALVVLGGVPFALSVIGHDVMPYVEQFGPGLVMAVVILVLAMIASRWISVSIRRFGDKARRSNHADGTLFAFVASLMTYMVMGLAIVLALTQLGVQTASLIALVGAAGLAIALALQDTLKAVASGVMLAIFRPYRIGDWVTIAGVEGEVTDITPFRTTIKPVTNNAVSLPNDKVWTDGIANSSRFARRRLDLYLDVSYEDDLEQAIEVTRAAVNSLPRVLAKDETWVAVHAFKDWSVQVRCRVWVAMPEYLLMRSDCLIAIKKAYDANGITIPYPQQVEMTRPYTSGPGSETGSETGGGPDSDA